MAFKMKGFPMHRGTSGFKKAVTEYSAFKAEDDRNPEDEPYKGAYAAEDKWDAMSNDEQQKWLAEFGGASEAIEAMAAGKSLPTKTGSDKGDDKGDDKDDRSESQKTKTDEKEEDAAGETTAAGDGDEKKKRSKYDEAKEKNPDLEKHIKTRNDPNASELEKAEAQDAINEAYGKGPTNRAEQVRAKQEKEKSEGGGDTKGGDTKATDTKGGDDDTRKLDHRNAEDRKKMTHREIFKQKQAERRTKKSERQRRRAAVDAWRAGGSKGPMPQKSNNWGEGSSPTKIYSKPKGKRTKY